MAAPLQVPRRYERGIATIRDLSDESARDLLSALRRTPPTYNQDSLTSAVAKMVDTIAASDAEEIVPALLSLYSYRDYSELSAPEVAQGIAQDMQERLETEAVWLPEEKRASFEKRLAQLLNVDSLGATVRAGMLSLDNEHTFQGSRILTDIRPVFDPDDADAAPTGAVIVHTLKISYRTDNSSKDFFVTLDTEDMRELMEHLERARSKAENLKAVLETAEVPYIDAE